MFGMSLFAPAGKLFKAAMRVPRRTNWHPSDLTKVCLAGAREQVIVCAKLSCMTSRSSTRKPDEFPVILRANPGAHTPAKEPRFALAFLGVRDGGLSPLWPRSSALPAIVAATWYEWQLRLLSSTIRLFVSIAPRGTTNQFDKRSRVAIQDGPMSEMRADN